MPHLESELKFRLTKRGYDRLLKVLRKDRVRVDAQTNYYFDTQSLDLKRLRVGCRIRKTKSQFLLTVKLDPTSSSKKIAGFRTRTEWESSVPKNRAIRIVAGIKSIADLKLMPINRLLKAHPFLRNNPPVLLGSMKTRRTLFGFQNRLLLEIDRYSIGRHTFYELECETIRPNEISRELRKLAKRHRISLSPESKSKLQRFFELSKKDLRHHLNPKCT